MISAQTQTHRRTDAQIHRYTETHRHTDTQTQTQTHRHTHKHTHTHTDTLLLFLCVHPHTSLPPPRHPCAHTPPTGWCLIGIPCVQTIPPALRSALPRTASAAAARGSAPLTQDGRGYSDGGDVDHSSDNDDDDGDGDDDGDDDDDDVVVRGTSLESCDCLEKSDSSSSSRVSGTCVVVAVVMSRGSQAALLTARMVRVNQW